VDEQRRDLRLFFRLNVFYGLLFGVSWLAYYLIPDISIREKTQMDQSLLQSMIVLPIAAVMTVIFCYTFLGLWKLNYGFRKEAKQYMRSAHLDSQEGDDAENELTG